MKNNLIDDGSIEHLPIDAIEMSESENEDRNKFNRSNRSNANEENEKLKAIIKDQQLQLNQMQTYIHLCESKIALLDSSQRFPIKDTDLATCNNPFTLNQGSIQLITQKGFESISDFLNDCVRKENDLNIMKHENEYLQRNYFTLNNQYSLNQLEISALTSEIERLRHKEEEFSKLQETYIQTCELNTKANEEKVSLLNDITNLKDHLNQRERTIESMSVLLNQNQCQYDANLNQIRSSVYSNIKREFDIQNEELHFNLKDKDNEINILKTKILSIEKTLLSSQSYANEAEIKLSSQESQLNTQCELNDHLSKDTYQSISNLMGENKELNDYISTIQDDIRKLIKKNELIAMKYNDTKANYNTLNDKYNAVNKDYFQLQFEYNNIEELYTKMSIQHKMLNVDFNSIKEAGSISQSMIKKNNNDLSNANETLVNDNNQLRLKLKMINETVMSKEIEINNLKGKIKEGKCNYDTLRQYNIDLELKRKELSESNKRLEKSMQLANEEISTEHLTQPSKLYNIEKLISERSKIIEELSNEKTSNKDKDTQLSHSITLLRNNKSKLIELKEEEFLTFDYCAYLTESSIAKDYKENIIKIEDFITNTVKEVQCLKAKFNSKLQLMKQSNDERSKLQNDNDSLLNGNYSLECKVKALQAEVNIKDKKIKEMTDAYEVFSNDFEGMKAMNDQLRHENKQRKDTVTCLEKKNDQMNESISLYETIRCFIEEILIKITKCCMYKSNIGILVNDLIKDNYDLTQSQRDKVSNNTINNNSQKSANTLSALNISIDSKFKEVEFIYSKILNEIDIEQRLQTNYSFQ